MKHIQVIIADQRYSVIGGSFWEMLESVKAIPGRVYVQKAWQLPLSLEDARAHLSPLQVLDEDELLEAEIADIQRVQHRILELREAIEQEMHALQSDISQYSFRSKSAIKGGKMRTSGCLSHALEYASMPVERMAEPQIKTLYAALEEMGEK